MAATQDKPLAGEAAPKSLPSRPQNKMAPIPNGCRIQKRPIPGRLPPITKSASRSSTSSAPAVPEPDEATADPDGYLPAPHPPHCAVIYISSKSPFMGIVTRARKALEVASQRKSSSKNSNKSLDARVRGMQKRGGQQSRQQSREDGEEGRAEYDVVLVATGRAIQKGVEVGAFFTRDGALDVEPRTRTLKAVDDVVAPEEVDEEDTARVRYLSCLEVGLRWKS